MRPLLVFIPGMLGDARVFESLIQGLGHIDTQVLAFSSHQSVETMAKEAWQILAALPAEQLIILCGFSMGGYVVLNMLLDMKRPIHSAVLISTSARADSEQAKERRQKAISYIQKDFPKFLNNLADFSLYESNEIKKKMITDMGQDTGVSTAVEQCIAIMNRPDLLGQLESIAIPVYIFCGNQDQITPKNLSQELAERISNSTLYLVDKAGHMLPLEQPNYLSTQLKKICRIDSYDRL